MCGSVASLRVRAIWDGSVASLHMERSHRSLYKFTAELRLQWSFALQPSTEAVEESPSNIHVGRSDCGH